MLIKIILKRPSIQTGIDGLFNIYTRAICK